MVKVAYNLFIVINEILRSDRTIHPSPSLSSSTLDMHYFLNYFNVWASFGVVLGAQYAGDTLHLQPVTELKHMKEMQT